MALLGDFKHGYTKTGENFFSRWSGYASYVPVIGAPIALFLGAVGTAVESIGWLLKGKIGSALTTAGTGAAYTAANTIGGTGLTWGSMLLTGRTLGTHARHLTEATIGAVAKPQVLSSYAAGIGAASSAAAPAAPGRFATQVSNERGANAQEAYDTYMRGEGGVNVNQLGSAYRGV